MILGRNPRAAVVGGTVVPGAGHTSGTGVIVEADAAGYNVYRCSGGRSLCWIARRELIVPGVDDECDGPTFSGVTRRRRRGIR
jgi:hypothetical protein